MRRSVRALIVALVVAGALVLAIAPSSGGIGNQYFLRKDVAGQAAGPFAVQIVCEQGGSEENSGIVAFTADGTPTMTGSTPALEYSIQGDAWVVQLGIPELEHTCTFTEIVTGGAAGVSFACEATGDTSCSAASGAATSVAVITAATGQGNANVTFTNTFAPEPVEAAPAFTG